MGEVERDVGEAVGEEDVEDEAEDGENGLGFWRFVGFVFGFGRCLVEDLDGESVVGEEEEDREGLGGGTAGLEVRPFRRRRLGRSGCSVARARRRRTSGGRSTGRWCGMRFHHG